ncbi:MAG TPA: LysM domain-containing protein [Roseiflexaceae bacterium]|nr:LysM domain-containing protein [Roseiflexaceae bacterium]
MPRSRMFAIYGLLAVFALGSGLLIARLFGTSAAVPSGYATPAATVNQPSTEPPAPTAPSAGQVAAATPNAAPTAPPATEAPTPTAAPPTAPPATEAPTPTAAPPTAPPATEAPAPTAAAEYVEYTVQRGDSLKSIAAKYGVTIRDIIAVNDIPNPDSLNVGSVLRIPKQ